MTVSDGGSSTAYFRYEFESYQQTREFLDRLAELSESCGFYPNVDFGRTYVRVSIEADDQLRLLEGGSSFIAEMESLARERTIED